ncbi:hypothetical protein Tco_0571496, partial [Tanacetum coccineum]
EITVVWLLCCWNLMGESGLYLGGATRPDSCLQPWQPIGFVAMASVSAFSRLVPLSEPYTYIVDVKIIPDFTNVTRCVLIGWDNVVSGRMVEKENHSPQQPPQAHPWHGLMNG